LLDVLKAHSLCTKDNIANMSVVSSYLTTNTGEVKDQSYYFKSNAFRDLIKAQNNKANKIEALIEIGDLSEEKFHNLGLKGVALVVRIALFDCIRRMLTRRTRGAHAEAWKAGGDQACRNASMNVNVCDVRKREK
jgi:hypothetical protein